MIVDISGSKPFLIDGPVKQQWGFGRQVDYLICLTLYVGLQQLQNNRLRPNVFI
jgi:hypothetical protein